jgi:hypothetical protein
MRHPRPHPIGTYETPIRLKKPAGPRAAILLVAPNTPPLSESKVRGDGDTRALTKLAHQLNVKRYERPALAAEVKF